MKKIRFLSFVLAVLMLCTVLAGCSDGKKTVLKVNGEKISKDVFEGAVAYCCNTREQSGIPMRSMLGEDIGDGRTGAQFLKDDAKDLILGIEAIRAMAKENGIEITKDDKKTLEENKNKQIEAAGDRAKFLEELEADGLNEAFYDYWMEYLIIMDKAQTELFGENGKYAFTAQNIADTFGKDYFCVKHVLIMAETEADFEAKKALADEIATRAKNGEDFDALIAEYGEDPGMASYTSGYVMDANGRTPDGGAMVKEFADASAALADGGVSDAVRSTYGYHIIKRYTLSKEYVEANFESIAAQVSQGYFVGILTERIDSLNVEETKEYASIDVYAILGVEKTIGEQVGMEESHEGHDHAEGEAAPEITLTPAE